MKQKDWQLMRFFPLWLVLPFMVASPFYEIFRICEKICENTCYKFFAIVSFALLPSSRFNQLDDCDDETCTSNQFLQIQKKQLIDLQEHLERYCNLLPVFGFSSAKHDLNLIQSNLLPIFNNERNIEPTVIKKSNQFISFKFGDTQLLDIMKFLGVATSLDSFLKAHKTSETKGFFPYDALITPTNCRIQIFSRMMLSTLNFGAGTLSKPNT